MCWERNFFELNDKYHDVQIFKRALLFSVEYRKFIKNNSI